MHPSGEHLSHLRHYLPHGLVATASVTVLPALLVGGLRGAGLVSSWALSLAVTVGLSMLIAAAGSAWWVRRPGGRDIVFADLMLWGWLRRFRTERRLANATWLLGDCHEVDPLSRVMALEQLSSTLEARDPYTHGHSRRVTRHAYMIARGMGLPPAEIARIRTAAALHDVGKLDTPREVLNKPGRLSDEEFALIQRHPVDGAAMVAELGDDEVTAIVRHHHERLDGGGYPDGLEGSEIPLGARIIAVADTFDALTSTRPYRPGCRHKKALDIMREEAGTQLDPRAVGAFLRYYTGRRGLPRWAALAEAPPRLAGWLAGAAQGVSVAPLGGGAAALGATFLVSGALLAPITGQIAARADATVGDAAEIVSVRASEDARRDGGGSEAATGAAATLRGDADGGSGGRAKAQRRAAATPGGSSDGDGAPVAPGGGAGGGSGGGSSGGGGGSCGGGDQRRQRRRRRAAVQAAAEAPARATSRAGASPICPRSRCPSSGSRRSRCPTLNLPGATVPRRDDAGGEAARLRLTLGPRGR